ncbi:hypothetical protein CF319_g9534, partial [Tilletia indica]
LVEKELKEQKITTAPAVLSKFVALLATNLANARNFEVTEWDSALIPYLSLAKGVSKEQGSAVSRALLGALANDEVRQGSPIASLSDGWKMKLALARAVLFKADILLLDEPTNHLDVVNIAWITNYLTYLTNVYNATAIIVSHDSQFLDNVCTDILHLNRFKIKRYPGNLSAFVARVPEAKAYAELNTGEDYGVWKHPNFVIGYVAQHAFHHIDQHLDKTPLDYMLWRYQPGEDLEEHMKASRQLSEAEMALMKNGEVSIHEGVKRVIGGRSLLSGLPMRAHDRLPSRCSRPRFPDSSLSRSTPARLKPCSPRSRQVRPRYRRARLKHRSRPLSAARVPTTTHQSKLFSQALQYEFIS